MKKMPTRPIRTAACCAMLSLLTQSGLVFAQDRPEGPPPADAQQSGVTSGGWRKVGDPPRSQSTDSTNPNNAGDTNYSQSPAPSPDQPEGPTSDSNYPVPSELTIRPGTFVTVRVNQELSSDRNQPGDAFSASLVQPIVVEGVVVARRGQTLGGRVVEAQKAGRVQGVSRLGIQLTELTLVDGQQVPIQSQLNSRAGSTSVGRDAGAIAGTTALGAAVGAAADWGRGAAIGAAAGAVAGTVGVLLTRGHPTEIYPESVLTFRIEAPVSISTDRAPQAFRTVQPGDYERSSNAQMRTRPPAGPCGAYGCPPPYYYYGPGYYNPYYYGPGFGFYYGPSFYFGPRFRYGYGFSRRGRR